MRCQCRMSLKKATIFHFFISYKHEKKNIYPNLSFMTSLLFGEYI